MKILLDENIDVNFKNEFPEFDVETVKGMKWTGIENGELLHLATTNKFEVFITLDSNIQYQQNLIKFDIFIICIKTKDSKLTTLKGCVEDIKLHFQKIQGKTAEKFLRIIK